MTYKTYPVRVPVPASLRVPLVLRAPTGGFAWRAFPANEDYHEFGGVDRIGDATAQASLRLWKIMSPWGSIATMLGGPGTLRSWRRGCWA